ncbi:MAG: DnaD domain protein, partial [Clostridia bacterium]|nr:DnaD domain protein [Clostridia bacterium]
MPFISASDGLIKKSTTTVENTFITQYLPALEPTAVKVYLFALFLCQNSSPYTLKELAKALEMTENEAISYFEYLEEYELVSIISREPFSVSVLETSSIGAKPKMIKPEKYSDFNKSVQNILSGRMVPPDEYLEYYKLLEENGFEQQALLMIIAFCVDQNDGKKVNLSYIKKVALSYADKGKITASQVDEYLANDRILLEIISLCGLKRKVYDKDRENLKKWRDWSFSDEMLFEAAKLSAGKSNPLTYMNKILSAWNETGIYSPED